MNTGTIVVLVVFGAIILFVIGYFITGDILYRLSISRKALAGNIIERHLSKSFKKYKINRDWWIKQKTEELSIITEKDKLVGYLIRSKQKTNKVAILIHGYYSSHSDLNSQANFFLKNNFNVFAPDLRAHGKSSGKTIGMGFYDKTDTLLWINKMIEIFGENSDIVLFGISMGGTTVCLLSGEDLPKNVKCIVSDCAYDSLEDQFRFVLKQKIRLPEFPLLKIAKQYIKLKAKYNLDDVRPIDAVKQSTLPILFIHGTDDELVPFYMSKNLYEASTHPQSKLYVVEKAGHALSYASHSKKYESVVINFVENNI